MYDITKFLADRSKIVRAIEKLEFTFDGVVGDDDFQTFETEIDLGNVTLIVNATIMETFIHLSPETRDEPADYVYERDLSEINEAYYINSEGDEIPCTNNEIEAIKNVIKSLI